jgi:pimeloyl-ACP methyl ester carboxylesterase
MLCLHGLTRNCSDFDDFAAWQSRERRVLTPDVRGRGRSAHDPEWRHYRPARYLEDVWTLLEAAGIGRTLVVGTSMGGLIAMLMAAAKPASLAAVVLNDVGPRVGAAGLLQLAGILKRLRPVDSWAEAVRQTRAGYEKALPGLDDAAWEAITRRGWRQSGSQVAPDFDPLIIRAIKAGLALPKGDSWALFGALRGIPTLLLRGASSEILTAATARKMQRLKPDLVTVEIADRGHAPLLNEPAATRAIAEFLQAF